MQKKIIPTILTIALIVSGFFALYSISNVQGNARVVNYTGIVRGATQKLVKEEISGVSDDALIKRLDGIIEGLRTGEGDNRLIRLKDNTFQSQMQIVEEKWIEIKNEIQKVRQGKSHEKLYKLSEDYFTQTDIAVHDAETYTEKTVQNAKLGLSLLTMIWLIVAGFVGFITSRISKRQQEIQRIEEENRKQSENLTLLANQLQAPMNDMSELIYITDMDTYELLFLNEAGQKSFHTTHFYGQKCYKILQGRDSPCPFCNNDILKENEYVSWEKTNPITKRHYLLKDRKINWNNHIARMEIAFDLTENENKNKQLQYLVKAEQMIVECLQILYQKEDMNHNIQQALTLLGKFLLAESAYYIRIQNGKLILEQEWHQDISHVVNEEFQNISSETTKRWFDSLAQNKYLIIDNIESLKEKEREEYEVLKQYKINRMIATPLQYNGQVNGFIGVNNPPQESMQHIVSFLQTLSYFIELSIQQDLSEKELARLSYHDTLTSFYNRNRYMEDVAQLSKHDQKIGVIYLDINGLKDINDSLGHDRGDQVITATAKHLKEVFYNENIYRIGGDEFVILCPQIEEDLFIQNTIKLKQNIQTNQLCHVAIGYRWSQHSKQLLSLIKEADADMYEDKRIYYLNHPKSQRYRHNNDELFYLSDEKILHKELKHGHFKVYLQPKISSQNNQLKGAEALIRYCNHDQHVYLPKDFLPLLEEHNLLSEIDYFVFEEVCRFIHKWKAEGYQMIPISINLSHQSILKASLNQDLLRICQQYDVSPNDIELEISEHIRDITERELIALIRSLKKSHFRIALDDFGKAFANFALLSANDFDVLKIDRSLVVKLGTDNRTKVIVDSISDLCQKLNIEIIAEGIETQQQLNALMSCNIYIVQGFFYDKPLPVDKFEVSYLSA